MGRSRRSGPSRSLSSTDSVFAEIPEARTPRDFLRELGRRVHPAGGLKAPDRNVHRVAGRYGTGEGTIFNLRCSCGHDLDRHLESEACDVEACRCLGFEIAWEEDEEIVQA